MLLGLPLGTTLLNAVGAQTLVLITILNCAAGGEGRGSFVHDLML
jgi:hypothetical protein